MNLMLDEDDEPVEGMPNVPRDPEKEALRREKMKAYLQPRMQPDHSAERPLENANADMAFIRLLQDSANQAGTIGGRQASSKPLADYQQNLMMQNQGTMNRMAQDRQQLGADQDRRAKLMQYFDKQGLEQDKLAETKKYHSDMLSEKREENRLGRETKAAGKADKDAQGRDKEMHNTVMLLESARGNPAVGQAEKDLYAADKVNGLIEKLAPGGDLNKLSPQAASLMVSEIGKIAQGTSPTMHEMEMLRPETLTSRFANIWQKVSNDPTPANVGAFLKQYQDYANQLTEDSKKVIGDKYGRIIESKRRVLNPEDYDQLQKQYMHRFDEKPAKTGGKMPTTPKVRVSNGTETFEIDESDVADAEKDGYRRMK